MHILLACAYALILIAQVSPPYWYFTSALPRAMLAAYPLSLVWSFQVFFFNFCPSSFLLFYYLKILSTICAKMFLWKLAIHV